MQVMRERMAPMPSTHTVPQMVHLRWGNTNMVHGMLYLKSIYIVGAVSGQNPYNVYISLRCTFL